MNTVDDQNRKVWCPRAGSVDVDMDLMAVADGSRATPRRSATSVQAGGASPS
jgi:hypothetical protein